MNVLLWKWKAFRGHLRSEIIDMSSFHFAGCERQRVFVYVWQEKRWEKENEHVRATQNQRAEFSILLCMNVYVLLVSERKNAVIVEFAMKFSM